MGRLGATEREGREPEGYERGSKGWRVEWGTGEGAAEGGLRG